MFDVSRLKFKHVTAVYTGGNIWLFYGEVNGAYFLCDDDGCVQILTESPEDFDESLFWEWQKAHMIAELDGTDRTTFCDKLADRLLRNVSGDNHGGISDDEIRAYKNYWRLPL